MRAAACRFVAVVVTLASGATVHAEDRPLLVVVESAPEEARAVRRRIAEVTGRVVVGLTEEGAERSSATLTVALSSDRRSAWMCYRNGDRPRYRRLAAPSGATGGVDWVAAAAADVVRRAEDDRADWSIADEVIDPFADEALRERSPDMRLPSEMIDPWQHADPRDSRSSEPGGQLSPPPPTRR